MTPTIGWSEFARKQHRPLGGNTYTHMTEAEVVGVVRMGWPDREPGMGETTLERKVVIPVPGRYAAHFFTPYIPLAPGLPVKAVVTQRQPGDDLHVETYVSWAEAQALGFEPVRATSARIVCYSAAALLENGGERSTDSDWEIVCLLASDREGGEPMRPLTMARNYLGLPGGTRSDYSAAEFAEAIMYWSSGRGIKVLADHTAEEE